MGRSFFPQVAWLTLGGTWRMRFNKGKKWALVAQRPYVAVPDGMDPEEAVRRHYGADGGPKVKGLREILSTPLASDHKPA